ncbi:MAG: cytochrome P450, partial [Candidatus Paceibacterota bacterium]
LIERYFATERMDAFAPTCRAITADVVCAGLASGEVDLMAELASRFAVRVQCAFLGWPPSMHEPLILWTRNNHQATLAQDRQAMSDLAREFEHFVDDLLEVREQAGTNKV